MRQSERVQQLPTPERKGHDAIFDANYLENITEQLDVWGCKRVLLVVSKTMETTTPYVSNLEEKLGSKVVGKKSGVGQHSPYADVIDIAHRIQKLDVDAVISIGSGSYSDASQVARLMAATLPPDFTADDMEALVDQKHGRANAAEGVKAPTTKLILVPTSLSAGEWNAISSCSNSSGKKQHFGHPAAAADLLIWDPVIASSTPPELWLASGVRCVDHTVETMCNPTCPPECMEKMQEGLRNLVSGLPAYKAGKEKGDEEELLEGISKCQRGSRDAMSGYLIHRVLFGPSHAIGHQLGPLGVMHGHTSCICLAPVLRFTEGRNGEAQKKVLEVFNSVLGWQEKSAGDAVERFVKSLGMPTRLAEVGITKEKQLDGIAVNTLTDVLAGGPGQLTELQEVLDVLYSVR